MAQDKNGYIPAGIQRQMDQHMQNMPAHLQKYQGGNTYIPQKAAQEMASYMDKTMPIHMKEYITPYMHQQTTAGVNSLDPVRSRPVQERAPMPNLMRRDHSAYGQQFSVNIDTNAKQRGSFSFAPQYVAQQAAPTTSPPPPASPAGNGQANYNFIFEDQRKPKRNLLPSGGSKTMRIIVVATGALVLLVIIIAFLSLLSGSGKGTTEALVGLAGEQNEIVRVSGIGITKARDSDAKNLAITTELSVETSQQQIIALLKKQGHKLGTKELNIKRSANTDTQLTAADTANTFDTTFIKLMTDELTTYRTHVKSTYDASKSKSEKSILADAYNGVNQLLKTPSTQPN